ncbi:MAG TPA: hypothetical protein VFH48_34205 [Chloroflexota bacterium]|nr:hypothetical protein [Chloroflexota bacterium]
MMISVRLVAMIEDHADQLTAGLVNDLRQHPRVQGYHRLALQELHTRAYDVYHNLGKWVARGSESEVELTYTDLGRRRYREGIPLSEVIFALLLTKSHLLEYVKTSGLSDTALDLYQELELIQMVSQFFDKAIYHAARGFEMARGF